uniref:Uncharacterized protein n=1 Tax=Solanum tuberosum TaxID=4113 RepID=M1DXQ8_SOLTU
MTNVAEWVRTGWLLKRPKSWIHCRLAFQNTLIGIKIDFPNPEFTFEKLVLICNDHIILLCDGPSEVTPGTDAQISSTTQGTDAQTDGATV